MLVASYKVDFSTAPFTIAAHSSQISAKLFTRLKW